MLVFLFALVVILALAAALFMSDSSASRWATNLMEGEPHGYTPRTARRRASPTRPGFTFTAQRTDANDEDDKAFERLVADALVSIPDEFAPHMRNIVVEVEQEPSAETLSQAGVPEGYTLLGLYRGVPLDKRGMAETAPDVITIYRGPIERRCDGDPDRIRDQVRATTLHELAHHFGIDHDEMPGWVK
jgi:predicted Zn-dependent protease with MMP-like domain